jgi:hypothetical protein
MNLTAKPITDRGDSSWQVTHGDGEIIVAGTNSLTFVADSIRALRLLNTDPKQHVVILTDAGCAWSGSIEQHPGA